MDPAHRRTARRVAAHRLTGALLAASLAIAPAPAFAISFPGETWGRVSHDLNIDTGTGISWFANQGIDWYELPGEVTVNTFAEYRYSKRTKDRTYFDASGPAVGLALRRRPFHLGVEHIWEELPEQDARTNTTRAYLTWYQDWYKYLRRRLAVDPGWFRPLALSGNTWGRVRHEFDGLESTSVSFFVNQGIDWFTLPFETTFNTYAEIRAGWRDRDPEYFTAVGPAVGIELQRAPFRLGTDYYWERFTERHETVRTWRLYLTWYYNWDLKYLGAGAQ